MKILSLALASTFAVVIFFAGPVLAQNQVVSGSSSGSSSENSGSMNSGGAMTSGENQSDERGGNWRGRGAQDSTGAGRGGMGRGPWGHDQGMGMRQRMMERHREMMMGALLGPRIRLARGNARIDVQCPSREDMKACVDAAVELLDKVAGLRSRAQQQGGSSGSGMTPRTSGSDERGQTPDTNSNEDEEQNVGPTPNNSDERM